MKTIGIVLALCVLGGCGTYHTMEELEHQAFLTGDWSRVEQRERIIEKRRRRSGVECPSGFVGYCNRWGSTLRCTCLNDDAMHEVLSGWR